MQVESASSRTETITQCLPHCLSELRHAERWSRCTASKYPECLRVPADVPVGQFWALTLYSENTRRPYDNGGETKRSVNLDSSLQDLKYNDDGSVDLFIGPRPPTGYESNFMKTVGEDGWFVYFRLYAPLEPFFDKSFRLPDFEPVES